MKKIILFIILCCSSLPAQSTWMMTNRVHPELKWSTISTKHFNIHYHQGIEEIAKEGAIIAEYVRPILLAQMDLDTIPTIDIIFTSEDEIMNGFATWMYNTFIWVDQNDAAIWLEKGKWLEQVLSHELQHIVLLHKTRSWFPDPWGRLISGLPGWVVEGTAEYETESWRPYRADISHKAHILRNTTNQMDPHHDGFSKMLYWADRFGDSTITKTLAYRDEFKLFNFGKGFKKATGITVKQFEENWRRHMNTYYYGYRSQKETYKEIGEVFTLPITNALTGAALYSDSAKIAMIGNDDKDQFDLSLVIAERDSTKEKKRFEAWEKRIKKLKEKGKKTKKDSLAIEKPYKEKVLWKKEEIDFGSFHSALSWSSDGEKIAYSKYHHGENQSMVYDIKYYDFAEHKDRWLTKSMRATYPVWLDSVTIAFVAHHNNVSNIYSVKLGGKTPEPITNYTDNTQIAFLSVSPNLDQLTFSMSPENGNLDIYKMDVQSGSINRLTNDPMADTRPVWHPSGKHISYTSNSNGVPNIHTIDLSNNNITVNTDAGDGIWTHQWMPNDSRIASTTLNSVKDSVRVVKVDPFRTPDTKPLSLRNNYTSWLKAGPDVSFVNEKPDTLPTISNSRKYKFNQHMRHFTSLVLPFQSPVAVTAWTDALGRHMFEAFGYINNINPSKSGYGFGYINAEHGPLWSISLSKNTDGSFRLYDDAKMIDVKNGVRFGAEHPMNFGESFSSNHAIGFNASFISHDVTVWEKTIKKTGEPVPRDSSEYTNLPIPDNGQDGYLSLYYLWSDKRPHGWNLLHPNRGFGVYAQVDYANKNLFGAFSYSRLKTDAYVNLPIKKTSIYFRLKTIFQSGQPPKQDYVGLTDDEPIYLNASQLLFGDYLPENHNPRGWSGYSLGDRLIFGTFEYRLPVVPKALSLNLISDYGSVWSSGKKQTEVSTAGYELRLSLGLIVLSAGDAQTIDGWNNDKDPIRYYRLVLINPF